MPETNKILTDEDTEDELMKQVLICIPRSYIILRPSFSLTVIMTIPGFPGSDKFSSLFL